MTDAIEKRGEILRGVRLSIPSAEIDSQMNSRLQELSGKTNVKGFRPGHMPAAEAKRRFGPGVEEEVKQQAMLNAFLKFAEEESVRIAGPPKFTPSELITADGDYGFDAEFEIFPEFDLANFKKLEIERPEAEVGDADVEENIEAFKRSRQTFTASGTRAAELGDRLTLDWTSTAYDADNKPHEDKREDTTVVLDAGMLPEPFVDGLKGACAGDERTITLPHEGDDQKERKPAVIQCKIKEVAEPALPELNAEFFGSLAMAGVEDEASFRAHIKQNLAQRLRGTLREKVKAQVMQKLDELHSGLTLPTALIEHEVERMRQDTASRSGDDVITPEMLEHLRTVATGLVRTQLVAEKIIKENNLEATEEKVKERVEQLAEAHPEPQQVITWYYQNEDQLKRVQSMVLEDQLVELVIEQAKVKTTKISYAEAIQAQGA